MGPFKQRQKILKVYRGTPLETGGTAHTSKSVSPPVQFIFTDLSRGLTVLDYGAGKTGRNALWLRETGFWVFAYDPHHGTDENGWEGISNTLPDKYFDVILSSYVLNVVPDHIENDILNKTNGMGKNHYHITRNKDIFKSFKRALERNDPIVTAFFENEFGGGSLDDANIMNFALHGSQTSRGFQRIPLLEGKGFNLVKATEGYKIYFK